MFLENTVNSNEQFGWIEVICGSMFSGKTEELIRRLRRAQFAKQKIEIFKPAIDLRYDDELVTSHDKNQIPSFSPCKDVGQVYKLDQLKFLSFIGNGFILSSTLFYQTLIGLNCSASVYYPHLLMSIEFV